MTPPRLHPTRQWEYSTHWGHVILDSLTIDPVSSQQRSSNAVHFTRFGSTAGPWARNLGEEGVSKASSGGCSLQDGSLNLYVGVCPETTRMAAEGGRPRLCHLLDSRQRSARRTVPEPKSGRARSRPLSASCHGGRG